LKKILFITWDGLEVQYIQGLFLSIFKNLIRQGYKVKVLQFTWSDKRTIGEVKKKLGCEFVEYQEIIVNKKLPFNLGYILAIFLGISKIRQLIKTDGFNIIMPRSIIPSLMCLLAPASRKGVTVVYDSDGFPHDERVDFQGWKSTGLAYRFFRSIEFLILHRSDAIITRSKKAKSTIIARAGSHFDANKVFVLWNGRDSELFQLYPFETRAKLRSKLNIEEHYVVFLYSGSVGEKYLTGDLLQFFNYILQNQSNSKVIILTTQLRELEAVAIKEKIALSKFLVQTVSSTEVCDYLNIADFGLFFCKQTFSTEAVFPTKLSEYLLSGLPAIISKGIGDCDEIALNLKGVYSTQDYNRDSYNEISDWAKKMNVISNALREENAAFAKQKLTTDQTIQIISNAIAYANKKADPLLN
jgi:glycosyltransferase involved in cell wall biosynthesis